MQLHQLLSNPMTQSLKRYAVISTITLTLGLSLYGCGESRVAQCNKVVTIANKTKNLAAPKDMSGLGTLADNIEQIRTEVQSVNVQDSKLKELQGQLLAMYGDVSQSLKTQVKATEAKDKNALEKAKGDLSAAASKESDIVDRLNALCTK
ncbi:hypothetical protein [Pseudanabaena sp. 'Roaring Creek']|uniref:hypothetical protein n=1 Tax=Pseudanabaena sp. 'Roaring Creek' TaxID=1681830 RepID=UPI0006D76F43|nr:hypothetical protein [Pseudanabaena sp. 'Roaring Creek']